MRLPLGDEIIGAVLLCFVIGMSEGVSMFARHGGIVAFATTPRLA
jgi:hypothetical protein